MTTETTLKGLSQGHKVNLSPTFAFTGTNKAAPNKSMSQYDVQAATTQTAAQRHSAGASAYIRSKTSEQHLASSTFLFFLVRRIF